MRPSNMYPNCPCHIVFKAPRYDIYNDELMTCLQCGAAIPGTEVKIKGKELACPKCDAEFVVREHDDTPFPKDAGYESAVYWLESKPRPDDVPTY